MKPKLIFVYNAENGAFNALADVAHKILSPQTYRCNLCAVTHSPFGMRTQWKQFLERLPAEKEFLHADQLKTAYGIDNVPLPAILRKEQDGPKPWIDAASINRCRSLDDLQQLIRTRMADEHETGVAP